MTVSGSNVNGFWLTILCSAPKLADFLVYHFGASQWTKSDAKIIIYIQYELSSRVQLVKGSEDHDYDLCVGEVVTVKTKSQQHM